MRDKLLKLLEEVKLTDEMDRIANRIENLFVSKGQPDQMKLGEIIHVMKKYFTGDEYLVVDKIYISIQPITMYYRGYYDQLAIQPHYRPCTVKEMLKELEKACSAATEYEGYKGGTYIMTPETPVWISPYGEVSDLYITSFEKVGDLAIIRTGKEEW